MRRSVVCSALMGVVVCLPSGVRADFSDDFESYPLGEICGRGGWEEWFSSDNVCGLVSDEEANSGSQSLKIIGATGPAGDDTVQRFTEDGGSWTFSIMTFVPNDATGQASIILLNTYPTEGNNNNWSVVVALDADSGDVVRWSGIPIGRLIKGRWVEFRLEIDLDADTVDYFYNGEMVDSGISWRDGISPGGLPRIRALDLYGDEPDGRGTTGTYFDDVNLAARGTVCRYTIKKSAKAKGGCTACPRRGDVFPTEDACEVVGDCAKKIKIKKISCPDGGRGLCKKIKGKRDSCR